MKGYETKKVESKVMKTMVCDCCGINLNISEFEHPEVDYKSVVGGGQNTDDVITIEREIRTSDPYPDGCYGTIKVSYDLCPKCFLEIVGKALNEKGVKASVETYEEWGGTRESYEIPTLCKLKEDS